MNLPERFLEKVEKTDTCWLWKGTKDRIGYGHFSVNGKVMLAHRFAVQDKIPEGQHVLHKCDNPSCVNPDHLFFGSHGDNMQDSKKKNRHFFKNGEKHPLSKLTDEQAFMVLAAPSFYGSAKQIYSFLNITRPTYYAIRNRYSWKHLPTPTFEDSVRAQEYFNLR